MLLLNHRGDPFEDLIAGLRKDGLDVQESKSLRETQGLLDAGSLAAARPTAVLLNPLVLQAGGVELELIEKLQADSDPLPVILLVEDLPALAEARRLSMQFTDFVVRPASTQELMHRIELAVRTRDRFVSLHQRAQDLANQVTIDFKTGLLSERHFKSVLQVEFKRAQRHHLPLSLLLVDVDNFKDVNDNTDYDFGDQVLCHVARQLKNSVRETDFAARYGGDEFVLLLPHTTPAEAVHTATRILRAIRDTVVESGGYSHSATVSIGIDTFDGRSTTTPDALRRRANKALHEAKRRGKDKVWLYSERTEGGTQGVGGG